MLSANLISRVATTEARLVRRGKSRFNSAIL
jgi:hypothetical protein